LLPLTVDETWIEDVKKALPELPMEKMERFMDEYNLPKYDVEILVSDKELARYFEETVRLFPEPKTVSNWIITQVLGEERKTGVPLTGSPMTPAMFSEMLTLIDNGTISITIAKEDVFPDLYLKGISAEKQVEDKGLIQISDEGSLMDTIDGIITRFPKEVEEFKGGKAKLLGFFVGQVMKTTKGKANPKLLNELLVRRLTS
jgi:aspartyl-tRNA(Asn)/glutamyl-tRNA(Gln) amidotransferase subunit B